MGSSLKIENISKRFGDFELKNISMEVKRGEYLVILGPTGAGKTLLLEVIGGFHDIDCGKIIIDGKDATSLPPENRNMGFVYQDFLLFPHMNVKDNIGYSLKIRRYKNDIYERKIKKISTKLGISHLLTRDVRTLSGGEAQRVCIARAIIYEPGILLLDEPLNALDPKTKSEVMNLLKNIHREGMSIIHITHDREEAMIMAERIAVMNDGKIVQIDDKDEIFFKPRDKFVAEFLGTINIYKGVAERIDGGSVVNVKDTNFYVVEDCKGEVHISLRPEYIVISLHPPKTSMRNVFECTVKDFRFRGGIIDVICTCGDLDITSSITRNSWEALNLKIGKKVYLSFKASAVHVF